MTLMEALREGTKALKNRGSKTPAADASIILSHVVGKDRAFLYSHPDCVLTDDERCAFFEKIIKRTSGVPVQYLTGCQEFMSLTFKVAPGVFIPRHDTEILVETVLEHLQPLCAKRTHPVSILDVGTGSGCIAVSLAYYCENCRLTAVDISEEALEVAFLNAELLGVKNKITFIKSDLFSGLFEPQYRKRFDIVVSNPPYIPSGEIEKLQPEVKDYEPACSLDGGQDGLDFYRALVVEAPFYMKDEGLLAFEVGYGQASVVCGLMEDKFRDIRVVNDLAGIERVVVGKLKHP